MHMKRYSMPKFWPLEKKSNRFVVSTLPGPHPKHESFPLRIVLRDVLGYAETAGGVRKVINEGAVLVDKKAVSEEKHPIGLMDVIEFPSIKKQFRVVADPGGLALTEIDAKDSSKKLCRIRGKTALKGGNFQLNLHDGRNVFVGKEKKYRPGDSVLIELPSQKILNHWELKEGAPATIVSGKNIGVSGKIKKTFERKSMVEKGKIVIENEKGEIETLREYVLVGEIK